MKNRKLLLIVSLVLALTMSLGGTLAYLQDSDADVNTMVLGNVKIVQNEQQWNDEKTELVEFEQDKPLLPYVGNLGWENKEQDGGAYRRFTMSNVVDKYVTVTNSGNTDAYIRTIIAVEMGEYANVADFKYKVVGTSTNAEDGAEFDFTGAWKWSEEFVAQINGQNYMIMTATHQDAVEAKATTIPSLLQVYVNKDCDNDDLINLDGNKNGKLDVLVISQAVQSAGFEDADTALNEAFKAVSVEKAKEWFEKLVDAKGNIKDANLIGSPSNDGVNDKNDTNNPPLFFEGDPAELAKMLAENTDAMSGDVIIELTENYDMSNYDWKPISVDGYHGAGVITIEGNGNTIKGLKAPLFAGGFAGSSGIVIKNLTIADSTMTAPTSQGSGAFICCVDSMPKIELDNCHAKNVVLNGKSRTGGLIGWTSGYSNPNDGPVKTYVTIKNCSVVGCTINAETESAGGIIGHSGASDWTYTTVTNCKVVDTKINGGSDRTGIYLGTSNIGETTFVDCTNDNVSGTLNENHAEYGRTAHDTTGKLVINGKEIK